MNIKILKKRTTHDIIKKELYDQCDNLFNGKNVKIEIKDNKITLIANDINGLYCLSNLYINDIFPNYQIFKKIN